MNAANLSSGDWQGSDWYHQLVAISQEIHANPELRFEEFAASRLLVSQAEAAGFTARMPYGGLETGFRADHVGAEPGPTVAILMEYDALPKIGHGCGHNLIAAVGISAAKHALSLVPAHPGTLSLIGTPAEEGGGGKIKMIEAGAFADVDAAMMAHPADRTLLERHGLAAHHLRVSFTGAAAHAAKSPEEGRSALAGAYLFLNAVDAMRQFIPSSARIHGIIDDGGAAPNIVPDSSSVLMFVRDLTDESANAIRARVEKAAHGIALATDTSVEITETAPTYGARLNNSVMADAVGEHLRGSLIPPDSTSPSNPAGSSDIGNVSSVVPTIHPYFQIVDRGVSSHTAEFAAGAITERAHLAAATMARALGEVAARLLTETELMSRVQTEFHGNVEREEVLA